MAMKKFRNMKVYEQSGYQYKSTPAIMLKGNGSVKLDLTAGHPSRLLVRRGVW